MPKYVKSLIRLLVQILCATLLVILIDFLWKGVPLFGIPKAEKIAQVEITHAALDDTRTFTDEEKITLARNCLGFLRYRPGSAGEEPPLITIRYTDKAGKTYEVAASRDAVSYKGKAHPLADDETFITIAEAVFFFDLVAP